jgi:hypothetical protein
VKKRTKLRFVGVSETSEIKQDIEDTIRANGKKARS